MNDNNELSTNQPRNPVKSTNTVEEEAARLAATMTAEEIERELAREIARFNALSAARAMLVENERSMRAAEAELPLPPQSRRLPKKPLKIATKKQGGRRKKRKTRRKKRRRRRRKTRRKTHRRRRKRKTNRHRRKKYAR